MRPTYKTVQGNVSALGHKELSSDGANQALMDGLVKAQQETKKYKEELETVKKQNAALRKQVEEYATKEAEVIQDLQNENMILRTQLRAYQNKFGGSNPNIPMKHTEIGDRPDTYYSAEKGTTYDIGTRVYTEPYENTVANEIPIEFYDKIKDIIAEEVGKMMPHEYAPHICDIDDEYHFTNDTWITHYPDDDELVTYDLSQMKRETNFKNFKDSIIGKEEE